MVGKMVRLTLSGYGDLSRGLLLLLCVHQSLQTSVILEDPDSSQDNDHNTTVLIPHQRNSEALDPCKAGESGGNEWTVFRDSSV